MLKASLDHTATVRVDAQCVNLVAKGRKDELNVFGVTSFDSLLDDMISVLVFDASNDVVFELVDQTGLLVVEDVIECLEERVSSMFQLFVQ